MQGSDLIGAFFKYINESATFDGDFGPIASTYRSYLGSFAVTGDPNKISNQQGKFPAPPWPQATNAGDQIGNVIEVSNDGFKLINDEVTSKTRCSFWSDALAGATNLGGESQITSKHCHGHSHRSQDLHHLEQLPIRHSSSSRMIPAQIMALVRLEEWQHQRLARRDSLPLLKLRCILNQFLEVLL